MGNAGGGPADLLSTCLGADVIFLGTGLPEDHWHASDESVDIEMLLAGAASLAHLWQELGTLGPQDLS
jgi:acetylornithine deacetylase/succinyl-diaminopimelate desuccinylase-like protein